MRIYTLAVSLGVFCRYSFFSPMAMDRPPVDVVLQRGCQMLRYMRMPYRLWCVCCFLFFSAARHSNSDV